ncbi:hypothetical protein DM860_017339 [Cuscuta australis]|uniref:Homeobox domain-containing protein n=1 Tax=Cuscuta australis TaxID=267555 RepID=A0A328DDL3_9ASTE|nr:hypothetical protein DM860_017339 [Cuscuta australis]
MDSGYRESGSENEQETSSSKKGKKQYHRHSSKQIQQLESYFRECQHPDDNQRRQLSMELGLEPKQIKFWFQNKRTQTKAQSEKADNNGLRTENERIHCENLAMREALKSIVCPKCDGEEERKHGLQLLMMENVQLKEEHERLSTILSSVMGRSAIESTSSGSLHEESNYLATTGGCGGGSSAPIAEKRQHETVHGRNTYPKKSPKSFLFTPCGGVQEMEKGIMIETVAAAMEEVVELLQADEPLWTRSPDDEGRLVLHLESYDKLFAKRNYLRSRTARTESSKDSGIVSATPVELIQMCLDPMKWMDFFPTIVHKAKIIEVVDSGILGGSLQLVTWVEHVQVDDKLQTHCLYKDLIRDGLAYGAKRWMATLQRMSERYGFFLGLRSVPPRHELEEVINAPLGRRNMMQLSHRMVRTFYETLSMPERKDSTHENGGGKVRVSLRRSNQPGQPDDNSLVVCAATSLRIPIPPEHLFDFFKDDRFRAQWDVLSHGYPVTEIARISTGTHPGNCVSIIQSFVHKESNMLMVQESNISSMESHIVYGLVELPAITSAINGEDPVKIPIYPSGFVMSGDGQCGSLLTTAFQILMRNNNNNSSLPKHVKKECIATVDALISSTIQKIKAVLDCSELTNK